MNPENNVLIGSFVKSLGVPKKIAREVVEEFNVDKLFIFKITTEKYLLTFNLDNDIKNTIFKNYKEKYKNTIQLHRNKETNTLYTINSLNKIVELQAGKKDKDHKVDWKNYRNSIILLKKDGNLDILPTRLCEIIDMTSK